MEMTRKVENIDLTCYNVSVSTRTRGAGDMAAAAIRNSLQNKLILFLLVAIVLPISTSIVVTYFFAKASVKESYIQENTTLLYQGSTNLRNYLERINQTSLLLYQNASNERSLYKIVEKREIGFSDEKELYVNLQYMTNSLAEAKQVHMYMKRSNISFRLAYNLPRYVSGASFAPDFPADTDVFLEPTHRSHDYGVARFPFEMHEDVFTIHRKILNEPTDQILGSLSIDVKDDMIREISEMLYAPGEEELFLFDRGGAVVFASEGADADAAKPWLPGILASTAASGHMEYEDASFRGIHLYSTIRTPFAEWVLVKRVPYEVLYQDARRLTLINGSIVLAFLVVAVVAAMFVSFHFTSPIKRLIQYIHKVESGQFDAELVMRRTDEIGILSRRFHQMIQRLDQLITKEYRLELANKTNQLKALQAQVNPHFLNNSLQSIGTLALQKQEKKIYSLIASLGKMMRYQMNASESMVPFAMEVDYVRAYLDLQAQRFEEKFAFRLDVVEEAKQVEVPRMILQPIVENCFKHGFVHTHEGEIRVTARIEAERRLVVVVEDNGAGVGKEALASLQGQLDRLRAGGDWAAADRIGLCNVQSRLQLYFDRRAFLTLEAAEPRGLRVRLEMPLSAGGGEEGATG